MIKKMFLTIITAAVLLGCESKKADNLLICGDYEVQYELNNENETVSIDITGDKAVLQLAMSASGARYVGIINDIEIEFWNKGNDWILFVGQNDIFECVKAE